MYFFENGHFVIFTSVDVLKPDVLKPDVLKTWRFVNLTFCKPDVSDVLKLDVLKPDVLKPYVLWATLDPLNNAAFYWATLHRLSVAKPYWTTLQPAPYELCFFFWATLHPTETSCTLLSYAAPYTELRCSELISTLWAYSLHSIELGCTPLSFAVHCWATLHPLSCAATQTELPSFVQVWITPDYPAFGKPGTEMKKGRYQNAPVKGWDDVKPNADAGGIRCQPMIPNHNIVFVAKGCGWKRVKIFNILLSLPL